MVTKLELYCHYLINSLLMFDNYIHLVYYNKVWHLKIILDIVYDQNRIKLQRAWNLNKYWWVDL